MSMKDPAIRRLRVLLETLADQAGTEVCAVFAPRALGLGLVAHTEVDQSAIDVANGVWARHHVQLKAGTVISFGASLVWPIFDGGQFMGVVFIDNAPRSLTEDDDARKCAAEVAGRLRRIVPPTLFNNYLAIGLTLRDARREADRDQLMVALRLSGGKIRATARLLGVTRETVYKRAAKLNIDLDAFVAAD